MLGKEARRETRHSRNSTRQRANYRKSSRMSDKSRVDSEFDLATGDKCVRRMANESLGGHHADY